MLLQDAGPIGSYGIVVILVAVTVGIVLVVRWRARKHRMPDHPPASKFMPPRGSGAPPFSMETPSLTCPACRSTFTDLTLKYCLSDGAALVQMTSGVVADDPGRTAVIPRRGDDGLAPTIQSLNDR